MSAELRVTFLGERQDAGRAVAGLNKLLHVLAAAEEIGNRGDRRISWQFAHLGIGSIEAAIVPAEASRGRDAENAFAHIVNGLPKPRRGQASRRGGRRTWRSLHVI